MPPYPLSRTSPSPSTECLSYGTGGSTSRSSRLRGSRGARTSKGGAPATDDVRLRAEDWSSTPASLLPFSHPLLCFAILPDLPSSSLYAHPRHHPQSLRTTVWVLLLGRTSGLVVKGRVESDHVTGVGHWGSLGMARREDRWDSARRHNLGHLPVPLQRARRLLLLEIRSVEDALQVLKCVFHLDPCIGQ
ncbi:hypothetical protein MSAN_02255700 [Mycena sanguinolenta]|uniref:Uncharacterized protein n=1 Tax=Mycena sanguinolenta TaxID=230812 RepID=A0A8H6X9T3_9AGAR|nr:hypothetical protein MSAN_02255700 [Mycena sanguinolenta]